MTYSTVNLLDVVGVMPFLPDNRFTLNVSGIVNGNTVYTVPADRTLIILYYTYIIFNSGAAGSSCSLEVRTSGGSLLYTLYFSYALGSASTTDTKSLNFPLELYETEKIIYSGGVNTTLGLTLYGVLRRDYE